MQVDRKRKASYSDGFRSKVALGDHQVASVVQFDDCCRVGLDLGLEGLVLLQLALWNGTTTSCTASNDDDAVSS